MPSASRSRCAVARAAGRRRRRRSRSGCQHRAAPLRRRSLLARDAALDLRARLSELRDHFLPRRAPKTRSRPWCAARSRPIPERPARLLIGDDRVSANPKLNNVVKGWKAARRDWVIIANSNVSDAGRLYPAPAGALAPQYRHRLRAADRIAAREFRRRKSSAPFSTPMRRAGNMRARLPASASPRARRCCGGATSSRPAAASKRSAPRSRRTRRRRSSIHAQGLDAHLVNQPFQQPLGARRLKDVWSRQIRWARLRRATFPLHFAPEILTTSLLTIGAAAFAAPEFGAGRLVERRARGGLLVCGRSRPRLRRRLAAELAKPFGAGSSATSCCPSSGARAGPATLRLARQCDERRRNGDRRSSVRPPAADVNGNPPAPSTAIKQSRPKFRSSESANVAKSTAASDGRMQNLPAKNDKSRRGGG